MAIELNDLIQVHDDILEKEYCDFLIELFETQSENQELIENDGKPNFTQFNLTKNRNLTEEVDKVHNHLIFKVFECKKRYYKLVDDRCFPEKHNFEEFRIKKYNTSGKQRFDTHVDVQDYESARRFLSFIFYLNDVSEGGETVFEDLTINPRCGRVIVFPPLWMYPHKGCPPISSEKYILSTYFHFK